jgi:hypothetical protein
VALSLGHESRGQLTDALAVRDGELELLRVQKRTVSEVYCHRERCRLLDESGRLDQRRSWRGPRRRLRRPEQHLAELDRLTTRWGLPRGRAGTVVDLCLQIVKGPENPNAVTRHRSVLAAITIWLRRSAFAIA